MTHAIITVEAIIVEVQNHNNAVTRLQSAKITLKYIIVEVLNYQYDHLRPEMTSVTRLLEKIYRHRSIETFSSYCGPFYNTYIRIHTSSTSDLLIASYNLYK